MGFNSGFKGLRKLKDKEILSNTVRYNTWLLTVL